MKEKLSALLNKEARISGYELNESENKSVELFYVRNRLETDRQTENKDLAVTIYTDNGDSCGSYTFNVNAADDETSLKGKLDRAIAAAEQVKNPPFTLVKAQDKKQAVIPSIAEDDLKAVAIKTADAIFKADHYRDGWINSSEIFIKHKTEHFLNSLGNQLSFAKTLIEVELIPTWRGAEEVELYLHFITAEEDYAAITREVEAVLAACKLRSEARKPQEKLTQIPVVIDKEMLYLIMHSLAYDLRYQNVYEGANHFKQGQKVFDYGFNLTLGASAANSAFARPFDRNGIILEDVALFKNGEVCNYWGSNRFGQYLKYPQISGELPIMKLDVDEARLTELNLPYLEIRNFSAPQLEAQSGYFGGEVRLGLYHDAAGQIIPLSGFSISGNIYEALKAAYFSQEKECFAGYYGPKKIIFQDLVIA